jgi:uncharacterized membrane protein YgcG
LQINPAFTRFQINSKYTFFCLSLIMLAGWLYFFLRGAGGRDPTRVGGRLPSSPEQIWMTVLGGWLVWANDPFAAVALTTPSFAAAGFYAFCLVTFVTLLLLYWMVTFDMARDLSDSTGVGAGVNSQGASAQLARRFSCSAFGAAVCFWLPKVIWCIVTWMLVLSLYLVQSANQISDPTYSIFTAFPLLYQYFRFFIIVWGLFYIIYVGVMIISGFYQCRVITPASRYILAITVITLASILAGLFGQGLLPTQVSSASIYLMVAQGAANLYIYFLMIAYLPAIAHSSSDSDAAAVRDVEVAAAGSGGGALTVYGGLPDAALRAKPLSEAYMQTDESALQPGGGHCDCVTMPITVVLPDAPTAGGGVGGGGGFGGVGGGFTSSAAAPRGGGGGFGGGGVAAADVSFSGSRPAAPVAEAAPPEEDLPGGVAPAGHWK